MILQPKFHLDGTLAEESSDVLMNEYMEHMYGELFKRASHPAYFGGAINDSMDLVGIENAEVWETAALFRYKSRRSFLEIVTHPGGSLFLRKIVYFYT